MNLTVRRGNSEEMRQLWNGRFTDFLEKYTARVDSGIQEVWLLCDTDANTFWGELHILWNDPEKGHANGVDTAYLLAFRVDPSLQGKGYGSMLMRKVLQRIREKGFTKATIGADQENPKLAAMYQNWGFTEKIQESSFTYCYNGQQVTDVYTVYLKKLDC